MTKKKVIFWSSVDPSSVLSSVLKQLVQLGFDVEVRYLVSDSQYRNASNLLLKIYCKLCCFVVYPIYIIIYLIFNRRLATNVVTTNPFFIPLIFVALSSGRQALIHLVWDLYPAAININRKSILSYRMINYLLTNCLRFSFSKSRANVFISHSMLASAKGIYPNSPRCVIIPVGTNDEVFAEYTPTLLKSDECIRILYSGNLGLMHDIDTFIEAFGDERFSQLHRRGLTIEFNSFGTNYNRLRSSTKFLNPTLLKSVNFDGPLEFNKWVTKMKETQISIVSLSKGAEFVAIPSKTYSSLAAGHAIIGICSRDSDLGRLIIENDCGWVVEPGRVDLFIFTLQCILSNKHGVYLKRCNAFRIGHGIYSSAAIAGLWDDLMSSL
jgi:glycosyltransferase involved in cell wall biosynthesis